MRIQIPGRLFSISVIFAGVLCVFCQTGAMAQDDGSKEVAKDLVEIGDEIYYQQKAPEVAKEQYVLAAQTDPDNIKANYMAGKTIMETINKGEAVPYFLRVNELDPDYRFDILYAIGRAYQYNLDFENAISYYNQYLEKSAQETSYRGEDKVPTSHVKRRIYECENGMEFLNTPTNYSIVNVGSQLNSDKPDYAPVINEDETIMIFTSRRMDGNLNEDVFDDNFPFEDIFISRKVDGKWSKAENIGEGVNTLYFESNLALSADGKQLYIYRDENQGDIYMSNMKSDGTWSTPEPISDMINSSYSENSISISPDGDILYFASDRPGGYGGIDIYKCEKDRKGNWTRVSNLGETINTPYDEDGPFIDYDGKTLYFSSRGRKGMGGYDIFKAEYDIETDSWSEPVNLGYPINTPDDDIYFVSTKDGKRGYYASVRGDGAGYLDIYMVEIPDLAANADAINNKKNPTNTNNNNNSNNKSLNKVDAPKGIQPVTLLLKVEDAASGEAIDAQITLKNMGSEEILAPEPVNEGLYKFEILNKMEEEYMLTVEKAGYVYKNLKISIPPASPEKLEFKRKVDLNRILANYTKVLEFIYFKFNSATLTANSHEELNSLKQFVDGNSGIVVEIAGHTDNIGAATYNKDLSQRRAQAVVNFLVQEGVNPSAVIAKGYGEEQPLASNDDEKEGRELNRRVELRVLETQQANNEE